MRNKIENVAVALLNFNTPEMTSECCDSVLKSTYPNFTLCVMDHGSTTDNYHKLKEILDPKVILWRTKDNYGYAGGMNRILEKAAELKPHYFLVMNNDTKIDPNAISAFVNCAQRFDDKCVVTGKVYHFDDPNRLQTCGELFNKSTFNEIKIGAEEIDVGQYDEEAEREMIDDVFMLLPFEIYGTTGGYSKKYYMNGEQVDLILRIQAAGNICMFTPDAKLWHKGSYSLGGIGSPKIMFYESESRVILRFNHFTRLKFIIFTFRELSRLLYSVSKGIIGALIGRTKNLKSRIALLVGFFSGIKCVINNEDARNRYPLNW